MIRYIFLILCAVSYTVLCDETAIVEIPNGKLQGSFNGQYYSFKGIPYAEPPVGENRFESPKPFQQKWSDVRDATKSGATCICLDPVEKVHEKIITGSEDCLFINVYSPKIKTTSLLPVIFFIHGGGFMFGSGDFLEETLLMSKGNFVFVTFNYRLGPLGFMSTEDGEITGNMGLKDQRLALEWVNQNIEKFGGDPKHVLMAGFSAGGASVEYQLLQPGVEKLVNSAYSLSGSALDSWAFKTNVLEKVKKVASILKCPNTESSAEIKKCLKEKPATEIVNSTNEFLIYNYHPLIVWAPSIESPESKDAILTEAPKELIKKGKVTNVPYLSSFTSQDAGFLVAEILFKKEDGTTDLEYFNKNYKKLLPSMLLYEERFEDETELDQYTEKLYKDNGISDGVVTMENFNKFIKLATDESMTNGIKESWQLHSQYSSAPNYYYEYDYPAKIGLGNLFSNRTDINFGCVHGDDVFLMFNHALRDISKLNDVEKRHSDNFMKLLETFVSKGVPHFGEIALPKNANLSKKVEYLHILENEAVIEKL
ncbi:esterase 6-like [Condylostylus longicornis]|uniref:esterase 6-like n=1 Tax=Condylostylus longicornis TaxID=2530218 RepID=UPI00244DC460|nr:esterase 6-like [Condylostylus longicornis]